MDETDALDKIFMSLQWNGRYQTTCSVLLLLSLVATVIHNWSVVFIGKTIDHQCRRPESLNITSNDNMFDVLSNTSDVHYNVTYGKCQISVLNRSEVIFTSSCVDGYSYTESVISSFVPEWDLVCDRKYLSDVSQTIYIVGQMVGDLMTRFTDTHGRRMMFLVTSVMSLVTAVIRSLPTNYGLYLVTNFISGLFLANAYQLANGLIFEMMPKSRRALPEQIQSFLWPVSLLLLCLIAYMSRHLSWRYVQLILSMISVYTLCQPWFIDESLRWLLASKKFNEAEKLVQKIARINKVDPQNALKVIKEMQLTEIKTEPVDPDEDMEKLLQVSSFNNKLNKKKPCQCSHSVFFTNKTLLRLTLTSNFLLLVDALAYEGLLMISPELTSDFYLGFTLGAITDFPAAIIFCFIINRINRKTFIGVFHIMAGLLLLVSTVLLHTPLSNIIPGHYWLSLILSLIARATLSTGYSAVLLYVPELFPTSIRNTGYGISLMSSYFASMISPYTRSVNQHYPWAPGVIFGLMCVVVPFTISSLPETNGQELPQTLTDMERIMRTKSKKKVNTNV